MNDLDSWLAWWRERSLGAMKAHRSNRSALFVKIITPVPANLSEEEYESLKGEKEKIWAILNDRHNVVLSAPGVKSNGLFPSQAREVAVGEPVVIKHAIKHASGADEFGLVSQAMIDSMVQKLESHESE